MVTGDPETEYREGGVDAASLRDDRVQAVFKSSAADSKPASLDFTPAHMQAILDAALDSVVIIDHHGLVREFNEAAQETFGYSREEVVGRELAELIVPPESREAHRRALARWTEDGPLPGAGAMLGRRLEVEAMRADGSRIPVELAIGLVQLPGPPLFAASIRDVSERRDAEKRLRSAERRYRTLVERLPLSVYIDRLDEVSSNIYTSPQIEPLLGFPVEEWVENRDLFVELLHPEDRERVLAAHQRTHVTGEPLLIEYRLHTRDGRTVWVRDEARVVPGDDEPVLHGYLIDITARREAEEQLRHQAFHDALTGLANRALFTDRVEHALVVRREAAREVAVLFLDLDDFKAVNDTLGHAAGDALLRIVGARLRHALRPSHTVARLGGDEFAILIEEIAGMSTAVDAAERLVSVLQAPFDVDGREVFVTASVGIALGRDADELLRAADVAMYRAKAMGKAQYVVYTPSMDEELVGRLELVADLRRARCDEDFVLHYQPVVDLGSRAVVGVEALVRWMHPTRGLLQPGEFISFAEETGKIVELGRWVLHEACRQVARWRAETTGAEDLFLNVNVSTRQVRHGVLVEDVRSALAQSGLPPAALTLELTESVLARRHEELRTVLEEVAALGVRLALDDFGTGYSSLFLLQDLPIHTLKVDRSFVTGLDDDTSRPGFLRAIVDLAQTLDVALVAEGMETAAQTSELRRLGCSVGQGFHFAPPLEAGDVHQLLEAGACTDLGAALAKREARPEAA
jgi:diguanylate cyclase (GGDEF)-like protein/PAS domain S-box-containing protein